MVRLGRNLRDLIDIVATVDDHLPTHPHGPAPEPDRRTRVNTLNSTRCKWRLVTSSLTTGLDLQHPVQAAPGCFVHPADLDQDQLVPPRPRRRWSALGGVLGARGDLAAMLGQHSADRLNPEPDVVFGDEPNYHGNRGSSARAKKLEAASRISLARLTSRSSASSFLILAASVDVVPGSRPVSTWDCLTQLRSVSGTTPTRGPTRLTAPLIVNDGSSAIASATNRTERSRNSSGYFLGAGMTPPFRGIRPSTKPGTIHSSSDWLISTNLPPARLSLVVLLYAKGTVTRSG